MRRKQRLNLIKRANDLMYDQTDKMKGLKGAKLYSEVMLTRGEQVVTKQKAKDAEKVWNHQFHENILEVVAKGNADQTAKEQRNTAKIEVIKRDRLEQVMEVRGKRDAEAQEAIAIGEAMKKRAQLQVEEELQRHVDKQKLIAQNNINTLKANERIKQVRAELSAKEKESDDIREGEKEEIEGRKIALKALEKRRFEKKQETRQKMIDNAVLLLAQQKSSGSALETKQADEIRAKEDYLIAAKAAKREAERIAIKNSRAEQVTAKREKFEKQWAEEDAIVKAQRERSAREEKAEQDKHARERKNSARLKSIQYADAAKKQKRVVEQKMIDIEEAKLLQDVGNQDDDKFAEICKGEIMRFTSEGKPTYTLMKALQQTQPGLLTAKLDPSKRGQGLVKD